MLFRLLLVMLVSAASPVFAQQLAVEFDIPRLKVAEYHRPYIALWLQPREGREVTNLAVLYDTKLPDREGEKWLKDMRQWWRRSGRSLVMPLDGVTGATRSPGAHTLSFSAGEQPLGSLAEGEYQLMIEAAREVGGREVVSIPFSWPPRKTQTLEQAGERELGTVKLKLQPQN